MLLRVRKRLGSGTPFSNTVTVENKRKTPSDNSNNNINNNKIIKKGLIKSTTTPSTIPLYLVFVSIFFFFCSVFCFFLAGKQIPTGYLNS